MPFLGELSALAAAGLWAGSSLIVTVVIAKAGPVQTNITRMIIGNLMLFLSIIIFDLPVNLSGAQLSFLFVSGIVGLVFGDTFLFKAFQQIGPRVSMLIMSFAPAIAAMLAYIFLGEQLSPWGVGGITVTLAGVALVVLERNTPIPTRVAITKIGVIYAVLGALGQGGGVVLAKVAFMEGAIHGIVASCVRLSAAIVILLPLARFTGRYQHPLNVFVKDRKILLLVLLSSFFGTYLGIMFSLIAVAHTKVGIASTLIATTPVLMLPLVRLIHKEQLSWKAMIGAYVAVGGVAILFLT